MKKIISSVIMGFAITFAVWGEFKYNFYYEDSEVVTKFNLKDCSGDGYFVGEQYYLNEDDLDLDPNIKTGGYVIISMLFAF